MALPLKTTADDVREIVRYLKTKPTGATLSEAKATVRRQVLDARKMSAYHLWGVVTKDGDRIKLTARGLLLAKSPDAEREGFLEIVDQTRAYRSVLEWLHHQNIDTATAIDVARHLHEHHRDEVGDSNDNTLRENAVCFFNIAEAAGLGSMTLGRGGKPTRLEVDRAALRAHIEAGPQSPPWSDGGDEATEKEEDASEGDGPELGAPGEDGESRIGDVGDVPLKVFIAHGRNTEIVDQIKIMLDLADIEAEVAEAEETTAIPVPDKVLNAMRRCEAGIIAVTADKGRKDDQGDFVVNENVLIEIGAAFVLYERRVVLVWDSRLKVPSNLQGLYRCEFEGDDLSWGAGMKLMKAIQNFKKPAREAALEVAV